MSPTLHEYKTQSVPSLSVSLQYSVTYWQGWWAEQLPSSAFQSSRCEGPRHQRHLHRGSLFIPAARPRPPGVSQPHDKDSASTYSPSTKGSQNHHCTTERDSTWSRNREQKQKQNHKLKHGAHDLSPTSHCQCVLSKFRKALFVKLCGSEHSDWAESKEHESICNYSLRHFIIDIIALQKFGLSWSRERDPLKATLAHDPCNYTLDENLQRCPVLPPTWTQILSTVRLHY